MASGRIPPVIRILCRFEFCVRKAKAPLLGKTDMMSSQKLAPNSGDRWSISLLRLGPLGWILILIIVLLGAIVPLKRIASERAVRRGAVNEVADLQSIRSIDEGGFADTFIFDLDGTLIHSELDSDALVNEGIRIAVRFGARRRSLAIRLKLVEAGSAVRARNRRSIRALARFQCWLEWASDRAIIPRSLIVPHKMLALREGLREDLVVMGSPESDSNRLAAEFDKELNLTEAAGVERVDLRPGALETLNRLHERGCKLGLFTLSSRAYVDVILSKTPLGRVITYARTRDSPGKFKPSPEALLTLLAEMEATPGHTLVVGDDPLDEISSYLAGVRSLSVTPYYGGPEGRRRKDKSSPAD
jgi:phosphoglycolate phosphatase-like HAD superfamily hydrolase